MKTLYEKIDMINSPFEAFYVTKENFIEKIAYYGLKSGKATE